MAILAIEAIHPDAAGVVEPLSKALQDPEPAVRIAALNALTEYANAAVPLLAKSLSHEHARYWAVLALGELGAAAKPAVAGLVSVLDDKRGEVRREALIALARIGPDAADAVGPIAQVLKDDKDEAVRDAAAFALGHIGPKAASAADTVRATLKSSDGLLKSISAWALVHIEPTNEAARKQAIALLTGELKNKNPRVQVAALKGLVDLNSKPEDTVALLGNVITEGNPVLVGEALTALSVLGESGLPALIVALKSPAARGRAATVLGQLGPKGQAAAPALLAALNDEDPEVRREVLFALGAIGPATSTSLDPVVKQLDDTEPRVCAAAAYALGRMGSAAHVAVPKLRAAMQASDPLLRIISAWALVHIAPQDPKARDAVPLLIQGLQNASPAVRHGAAEGLGILGPLAAAAKAPLEQVAAGDSEEPVRKAAAHALELIGNSAPKGKQPPQK
jgi:HEAT repeat protein